MNEAGWAGKEVAFLVHSLLVSHVCQWTNHQLGTTTGFCSARSDLAGVHGMLTCRVSACGRQVSSFKPRPIRLELFPSQSTQNSSARLSFFEGLLLCFWPREISRGLPREIPLTSMPMPRPSPPSPTRTTPPSTSSCAWRWGPSSRGPTSSSR